MLIVHHATQGLSADAELVKSRLGNRAQVATGSEALMVQLTPERFLAQIGGRPPQLLVHLEHVFRGPAACGAVRQVLVPNPEWFTRSDEAAVRQCGLRTFWHKTDESERLFRIRFPDAEHARIPWTSPDRGVADAKPDYNLCLHVKGCSEQKQTGVLLQAWARHPEWPVLHVVSYLEVPGWVPIPFPATYRNIVLHQRKLPVDQLRQLMNACGVHLCPSDAEGYGHYIAEAMSCRALVVTTRAAPMSELVPEEVGVWAEPSEYRPHRASSLPMERACVSQQGIEAAVAKVLSMPVEERARRGAAARALWEARDQAFRRHG